MVRFPPIKFLAFWVVVGAAFVLSAVFLVLSASGYRINFEKRTVQKTALLAVKTTPKDAVVYLNGKALDNKTPIRLSGILPDIYELKIEKAGHKTWQKTVNIEEGLAYDFDRVILFLEMPVIESVDNPPSGGLPAAVPDQDLQFGDGEIWYKDKLVTRLSKDILNAVVYPDKHHIVFQVSNEIRVVEIDGGNNSLLVGLDGADKTVFGFQDEDTLIYQDGDKVKRARIL